MKPISILFLAIALLTIGSVSYGGTLSALLKNQNSYNYLDHYWQKQDVQLDVEFNTALTHGDLTVIGRVLVDGSDDLNHASSPDTYSRWQGGRYASQHAMAELRELYWTFGDATFWKIGKQQVVWGEADGLKLLDVVNPQSYREFILDDVEDSRIPLWMVKAEVSVFEDSQLQLLWVPDSTTHDLAPQSSPFAFTSPLLVPVPSGNSKVDLRSSGAPNRLFLDSDVGGRLSTFTNGWDMTFNYLYHYVDEPVFRTGLSSGGVVTEGEYERSHLLGGSASSVFGNWTVRTELAYEKDRYHRTKQVFPGVVQADQFGSVIGFDYQGWTDQLISFQWFQTTILDNTDQLQKERTEDTVSLLWDISFMNETLKLRFLNLYSVDHDDGLLRPKLTYNLLSNLDVILSLDKFYGDSDGVYGQFDENDRVSIGFELGLD